MKLARVKAFAIHASQVRVALLERLIFGKVLIQSAHVSLKKAKILVIQSMADYFVPSQKKLMNLKLQKFR